MMERGRLYFMISPPRAGKSTYANKWVQERPLGGKPRVIVCEDDIHLALGHRYNSFTFGMVGAIQDIMIRAYLIRGFDVLVDETHTTYESIKGLLRIDPDAVPIWLIPKEKVGADDWDEIVEELHHRAMETQQPDLAKTINRCCRQLVILSAAFDHNIERMREEARTKTWDIV